MDRAWPGNGWQSHTRSRLGHSGCLMTLAMTFLCDVRVIPRMKADHSDCPENQRHPTVDKLHVLWYDILLSIVAREVAIMSGLIILTTTYSMNFTCLFRSTLRS